MGQTYLVVLPFINLPFIYIAMCVCVLRFRYKCVRSFYTPLINLVFVVVIYIDCSYHISLIDHFMKLTFFSDS